MSHPPPPPPSYPPGGGYGPPGPPLPGGYGAYGPPQTAPLSIVALVLGLLGMLGTCLCAVGGLIGAGAVVCGFIARGQVKASGGRLTGDGFAIGGIVTGAIGLLGLVALVAIYLFGPAGQHFGNTF